MGIAKVPACCGYAEVCCELQPPNQNSRLVDYSRQKSSHRKQQRNSPQNADGAVTSPLSNAQTQQVDFTPIGFHSIYHLCQ